MRGGFFLPFFDIFMYTTYILFSSKINKYYTGHTIDLNRRLIEHNHGKTAFMSRGVPWEVVYTRTFNSRIEAMKLEIIIKKRGAQRFLNDMENHVV
jgi:putative endonuclease